MAMFGPQLIFTVIMFVLLTKLGKFYSLGRYLLSHKLFRYLSPGTDELKKTVRTFYKNANSKNKRLNRMFEIDDEKEDFNIPEGCTVELSMSPVLPHDFNYIKYTDDFQTFVDMALAAICIYASTELYMSVFPPRDEINLSLVWCLMVLVYGLSTLATITINYLRSTSEASLLYVFAALSFVVSLLVQMADARVFEFHLVDAFRNVSRTSVELITGGGNDTNSTINLDDSDKPVRYPTDELLFTCIIATLSGLIGALLFFPAFRLARLHFLCLKYAQGSLLMRFLYYLNFFAPFLVSICWLRTASLWTSHRSAPAAADDAAATTSSTTVADEFLAKVTPQSTSYTKQIQAEVTTFLLNLIFSDNLKLYLVLLLFVIRLVLYRFYAQSYLNLAFEMAAAMRKNSQRITSSKYIKTISSVYQYYGVVACQYVIPLFILLFMAFLLKTLGDLAWCGEWSSCHGLVQSTNELIASYVTNAAAAARNQSTTMSGLFRQFESEHFNITRTHTALNAIFTPLVFRSLLGYFTFWTCTVWFLISCFGLLYYHYIDRQFIFSDD